MYYVFVRIHLHAEIVRKCLLEASWRLPEALGGSRAFWLPDASGRHHEAPRGAWETLQDAQSLWEVPGGLQEASGRPQEAHSLWEDPGGLQEGSGTLQGTQSFWVVPEGLQEASGGPRRSRVSGRIQEGSKTSLGRSRSPKPLGGSRRPPRGLWRLQKAQSLYMPIGRPLCLQLRFFSPGRIDADTLGPGRKLGGKKRSADDLRKAAADAAEKRLAVSQPPRKLPRTSVTAVASPAIAAPVQVAQSTSTAAPIGLRNPNSENIYINKIISMNKKLVFRYIYIYIYVISVGKIHIEVQIIRKCLLEASWCLSEAPRCLLEAS